MEPRVIDCLCDKYHDKRDSNPRGRRDWQSVSGPTLIFAFRKHPDSNLTLFGPNSTGLSVPSRNYHAFFSLYDIARTHLGRMGRLKVGTFTLILVEATRSRPHLKSPHV